MPDGSQRARQVRPERANHHAESSQPAKQMTSPLGLDVLSIAQASERFDAPLPQRQRAGVVLSLQRTLGNARTSSLLSTFPQPGSKVGTSRLLDTSPGLALRSAGEPLPVQRVPDVQRGIFGAIKKLFGPKKVDAKGADKLIRKHFAEDLPESTKKNAQAQGHVNIVGESEFKVAYERVFGEIDDDYELTNAFVERATDPPTVWGHKARINPTTVLHEGMHFYSNLAWKNTTGFNANEGLTEYFTRQTVAKEKLTERDNYQDQFDEISALANIVGDSAMREAYFSGNVEGVKNSLDRSASPGAFDAWVQAMKGGDYSAARAALTKAQDPVPAE